MSGSSSKTLAGAILLAVGGLCLSIGSLAEWRDAAPMLAAAITGVVGVTLLVSGSKKDEHQKDNHE
jgi:hypothetical protein